MGACDVTFTSVLTMYDHVRSNNTVRLSNDTYGELTWLNNVPRVWEEKKYLYPIPQTDIVVNPALGQNPWW